MVFIRRTNKITLFSMLGLDLLKDENELEEQIKEKVESYNEGKYVILDRAFLSTSLNPNQPFEGNVEWIVKGHKGKEALFLGEHSKYWQEEEVLFQAGTRFRLLKICPPGTAEKIYKGDPKTTWKIYIETIPELEPLRGQ